MTRKIQHTCYMALLFILSVGIQHSFAQSTSVVVNGIITESGTKKPLSQVTISATATGKITDTNDKGEFTISVPNKNSELSINLPGYHKRQIFINGREFVTISLVPVRFKSIDKTFNKPLGQSILKDEIYSTGTISNDEMSLNNITSFDQALQGIVPGLNVTNHSGMPGSKSALYMRGVHSIYGRSEPLLIIDGVIHDYNYANHSSIEGFTLNPFEIVDVEDIADITVLKNGDSHFGSASSNGVILVNTEQKSEASTLIKFTGSAGVSLLPKQQSLLNNTQFTDYYKGILATQGFTEESMRISKPWLYGEGEDRYKYDNNTDWQKEIYSPGILQKYHIFLKGGDDIATYNISTGITNHEGPYENSGYNRFNLRINGMVNITSKFSVAPIFKLSLTDTYIPNLGPTYQRSPILSSILKAPIMSPYFRDKETGQVLDYLDNEGVFGVSNPVKLIQAATGSSRNYHFGASIKGVYVLGPHLNITNLVGLNFNNSRENIFIPNDGVVSVDIREENSPIDFVYEYRSVQDHATLNYNNKMSDGQVIAVQAGFRYMKNSYRYNHAIDLNTASDDFKDLGNGGKYQYLRKSLGDNRELLWMSYFANGNYSIQNKYFINANISVDANSAVNDENRMNIFPSIGGAWRLSSEEFMAGNKTFDDVKLRLSYSQSGNMYSSIYDYSKLYYTEDRVAEVGVPVREAIPNKNLELEKTSTINFGVDLTSMQQTLNIHFDAYYSMLNNLVIEQKLPPFYGYTEYYDNGGKLANMGVELAVDYRKNFGDIVWTIGATATAQKSSISELNFIEAGTKNLVTPIRGAEFVTAIDNPINSFYGYQTNGIYNSNEEANKVIGPNGIPMQAGDIIFKDQSGPNGTADGIINEYDKAIIGNPNPDIFGGLFTSVIVKSWEIKAVFNYSVGNDIFNYTRFIGESMSSYGNQMVTVLDSWSENNKDGLLPRTSYGDPTGNTVFSNRWIEDGSYLKLKHLTVSYNLPKSKFYSGIKVYLTASNLLTLTKYSGNDPEFYYSNSPFYMGVDYGKTPQTRSFILGVKLDL